MGDVTSVTTGIIGYASVSIQSLQKTKIGFVPDVWRRNRDCTWTKLLRFIQNSEGNSRQTSFCLSSMVSHSSSLYLSWSSVHTCCLKRITEIVYLNIART